MGLRINSNLPSVTALRNLRLADARQSQTLERLATGLRINRASDDPSGLVISENLRSQIEGMKQAVENSHNAKNMVSTAEAALGETSSLLIGIRESLIFALNDGSATREQIAAEQDSVDSAIQALKRIADTSRFGTKQLLNGASSFDFLNVSGQGILNVTAHRVRFDESTNAVSTDFDLQILQPASGATAVIRNQGTPLNTQVVTGGSVTLRITGDIGSEDITLASGTTLDQFQQLVNVLRGSTGIYMVSGAMVTEKFGSEARLSVEKVSGAGSFNAGGVDAVLPGTGDRFIDTGRDAVVNFEGLLVTGAGNSVKISTSFFEGTVELNPLTNEDASRGQGVSGSYGFTIRNGTGLRFQLGNQPTSNDLTIIGLPDLSPSTLGVATVTLGGIEMGGFLTSLVSGGENDLFTDAKNALFITDAAIGQILEARAYLGAYVADVVDPNIRASDVAIENLTASESDIRDLDFAAEVAELTKSQILFQSGISVLAQSNLIPQSVLQLLQG